MGTMSDEWPRWENQNEFCTPRFKFACSVSDYSGKTQADRVALLKDRDFLKIYKDLVLNEPVRSVFEIGFFQGGMPLFLADMVAPDKVVAIDWNPPTDEVTSLIERSGLASTIKLIGNVDQADTRHIRSILDEQFRGQPLDLIIDDCSHFYPQTKACFEALFGYLRPGGKYVIEDWAWTHWPGAPWQTLDSPFYGRPSMTNLIFELIMALGSTIDVIASVNVASRACVIVTRGDGLPHKAAVDLHGLTRMAGRKARLISQGSLWARLGLKIRLKKVLRLFTGYSLFDDARKQD